MSSETQSSDTPRLTFGVVSDLHVIAENVDRGWQGNARAFRNALKWFDAAGADAVLCLGDMADVGLVSQLQCVADAWDAVFPGNRSRRDGRPVERLFIYGNHDAEGGTYDYCTVYGTRVRWLTADHIAHNGLARVWREVFDEDYAPVYRKTIKGYDFICANWETSDHGVWSGRRDVGPFFERIAPTLDPSRPFFFLQHPLMKGTCHGPWAGGADDGFTRELLTGHPNAIAFMGHTHYSPLDERAIWQGPFTAIDAGSLRYASPPSGEFAAEGAFENTSGSRDPARPDRDKAMLDFSREDCRNGLFVRVYGDRVEVERRDFFADCAAGPVWTIRTAPGSPRPYAHATRAATRVAPEFAPDARLAVSRGKSLARKDYDEDAVLQASREAEAWILTFPAARQTDENRVHRYDVEALDAAGAVVLRRRILSPDYGFPLAKAVPSLTVPIPLRDLPPEGAAAFRVTPYECFGRGGRPLSAQMPRARC